MEWQLRLEVTTPFRPAQCRGTPWVRTPTFSLVRVLLIPWSLGTPQRYAQAALPRGPRPDPIPRYKTTRSTAPLSNAPRPASILGDASSRPGTLPANGASTGLGVLFLLSASPSTFPFRRRKTRSQLTSHLPVIPNFRFFHNLNPFLSILVRNPD